MHKRRRSTHSLSGLGPEKDPSRIAGDADVTRESRLGIRNADKNRNVMTGMDKSKAHPVGEGIKMVKRHRSIAEEDQFIKGDLSGLRGTRHPGCGTTSTRRKHVKRKFVVLQNPGTESDTIHVQDCSGTRLMPLMGFEHDEPPRHEGAPPEIQVDTSSPEDSKYFQKENKEMISERYYLPCDYDEDDERPRDDTAIVTEAAQTYTSQPLKGNVDTHPVFDNFTPLKLPRKLEEGSNSSYSIASDVLRDSPTPSLSDCGSRGKSSSPIDTRAKLLFAPRDSTPSSVNSAREFNGQESQIYPNEVLIQLTEFETVHNDARNADIDVPADWEQEEMVASNLVLSTPIRTVTPQATSLFCKNKTGLSSDGGTSPTTTNKSYQAPILTVSEFRKGMDFTFQM